MARFEDWPERLHVYLSARANTPFVWGLSDCLMTVCSAIESMTGRDAGSPFRGRYTDERGANELIAPYGDLESLVARVAADAGFPEVSSKFAGRGDLVLLDGEEGTAFGLVYLNGRDAVFASDAGLRFRPVTQVRRAWRVA